MKKKASEKYVDQHSSGPLISNKNQSKRRDRDNPFDSIYDAKCQSNLSIKKEKRKSNVKENEKDDEENIEFNVTKSKNHDEISSGKDQKIWSKISKT
jgi:hypothetical protein